MTEKDFNWIRKIDLADYAGNFYRSTNTFRPMIDELLDEIDRLRKENGILYNLYNEKLLQIGESNRFTKIDHHAYENNLIENGTHLRACTGEIFRIKKES